MNPLILQKGVGFPKKAHSLGGLEWGSTNVVEWKEGGKNQMMNKGTQAVTGGRPESLFIFIMLFSSGLGRASPGMV